jgi:hypothetical protein
VSINSPQDALISIILFLVGVIFGVGIIYQKISEHGRRIISLEVSRDKPVSETTAVVLLTSELAHLKIDVSKIEGRFDELKSLLDAHYRNIQIMLNSKGPDIFNVLREKPGRQEKV